MDFAEFTDEQLVYWLGMQARADRSSNHTMSGLDEALQRGLLLKEDGRGNGVALYERGGGPVMTYVFRELGHAWSFWVGMGSPQWGELRVVYDPRSMTMGRIGSEAFVRVDAGCAVVRDGKRTKLRVINGGKMDDGKGTQGARAPRRTH
jgi:hypothetical protein